MTDKTKRALRKKQIDWLRYVMEETGLNASQIEREANVGSSTLRGFLGNEERTLSDRIVLAIYKKFRIEPTFSSLASYDIASDSADISEYAKLCKQYVSDVCKSLGIYRNELAKAVKASHATFGNLFKDQLPQGLDKDLLARIYEYSEVGYSPALREYLSGKQTEDIPIVGKVSLLSSDEIIPYAKDACLTVSSLPGIDEKSGEAVELYGPAVNPLVKDGFLLLYNRPASGVDRECLDCACVVEDEKGQRSVKLVSEGSIPGVYNLTGLINGQMTKSRLKWAAKILYTIQR